MSHSLTYAVDPGWRILWSDLGVDQTEVLRRAELPEDLLSHHRSLTVAQYFSLWEALETTANDPLWPLHVCERYSVEAFQPALFAALCSPNLVLAAERLSVFKTLNGPMALDIDSTRDVVFKLRWLDRTIIPPASLALTELMFLLLFARAATREPIDARSVILPDELRPVAEFTKFLGVEITKGNERSISFSQQDAHRPFLTHNQAMWNAFEPELRRRLHDLGAMATMAERVHAALLELLPSGRSSVRDVAAKLSISARTLQRHLELNRQSFQSVLDRTRKELAMYYLERTPSSLAEISFLLGYAKPSSFSRAFHAWTGQTPETARVKTVSPSRGG